MNLIIEGLGLIAMISLVLSWIPYFRDRPQLFNITTLIAVIAFLIQFILLQIIFNILTESALLFLTSLAIYRQYRKDHK